MPRRGKKNRPHGHNRGGQGPGNNGQGPNNNRNQSGGQNQGSSQTRDHNRAQPSVESQLNKGTLSQEAPQGTTPITSVVTPRKQIFRKQMHQKLPSAKLRPSGLVFFDSLHSAKANLADLKEQAAKVGQLNIVIRAEGPLEDPELSQIGKVFAGAAWTLIHERRVQDGWYDAPRE